MYSINITIESWHGSYNKSLSYIMKLTIRNSIIYLFHALVLVVPLVLSTQTDELFEFNKMILTYGLTILIVGCWAIRMILEKRWIFRRTPFDLPLFLFVCSQIFSTLFSIHPRTSWFGYYSRFNGGLLSILTYVALYYAFVTNVHKEELRSFLRTLLYAALLVCLYAIPEHFGHSPSCLFITGKFDVTCWIQDVKSRVFATFGQPNWLAAYLITLIPLTITLLLEEWTKRVPRLEHVVLLSTFFATLLFTGSRSGLLGLGGGLLLYGICFFLFPLRTSSFSVTFQRFWKPITTLIFIFSALLFFFGEPFLPFLHMFRKTLSSPTSSPSVVTQQGTQLENGGTESGAIRAIVWKGAIKVWQRYPLFGSGVETFGYSYFKDRPIEHNMVSEWDFLYNKAHNEFLNYLSTTGILGLGTYILFIGWVYAWSLTQASRKPHPPLLIFASLAGYTGLHISNFFGFSTVFVSILFYLIPAWCFLELSIEKPIVVTQYSFSKAKLFWIGIVGCVAIFLLYSLTKIWLADAAYASAKKYENPQLNHTGDVYAFQKFQEAIQRSPQEALFHNEFSSLLANLALLEADQNESTLAGQLARYALNESNLTMQLNPVHLNFYKTRVNVFITLAQLDPNLLLEADKVLQQAIELAPTDPKLPYSRGLIAENLGHPDQALLLFQEALRLKPDYAPARDRMQALLIKEATKSAQPKTSR